MTRNSLFITISILFLLFPLVAEGATLYLMPQSQTVYQGDTFIIEVRLDTEDEEINAVRTNLTFSASLLEIIDLSKGGSILSLWVKEPSILNGGLSFLGGVPGGFKEEGRIGRIIFKGKEIGKAEVNFKESSQVLLNDGKGTPASLTFFEGNYQIIKKPEELPIISSSSHPDQNKWFKSNTLHLRWDLIEGAQYSYLLSRDPLAEPDDIPDRPEGELIWMGDMEYKGLEDGVYYFTLKQKLPGEDWSKSIAYRAMIDAISPEAFGLEIAKDPSIFEGKYFLSFATTDKTSGLDYYEIKEGKRELKRVTSPYLLEEQKLGKKIMVRAYDKAGNWSEAEIKPPYEPTWKDLVSSLLVLIGMILVWWILKRISTKLKRNYARNRHETL